MSEISGFVFPIKLKHAESIFIKGKKIFVKYDNKLVKLNKGMRAIFYLSGEKTIIGEAKILKIERMTVEEVYENYGQNLFLTQEELFNYAKKSPIGRERKTQNLSVYHLANIQKYQTPIKSKKRMTPAGYYLRNNDYQILMKR
ncbi:MAG: DUF365 domain-containing protein [Candidatus Bathyarchaeum tardum]|nr:MAG: DUF365 domain-containing protein [Candidatus Bathyarchaeum tardum]